MRPDFGSFILPAVPQEDEAERDTVRRARQSPNGVMFTSVAEGTCRQFGYTLVGRRVLHVDLNASTLQIYEEWGRVVTARRTRRLSF